MAYLLFLSYRGAAVVGRVDRIEHIRQENDGL
jgi:hypothetical protein